MRDLPAFFFSPLLVALVGCGGNIESTADADAIGAATVDGSIAGRPIPTTTTLAIFDGTQGLRIVMDNLDNGCALQRAGRDVQSGLEIFTLGVTNGMLPVVRGVEQAASHLRHPRSVRSDVELPRALGPAAGLIEDGRFRLAALLLRRPSARACKECVRPS